MNFQETQTFLTMLWSLFPNAPKCDAESKKAMVAAWFYVLHEYALNDAWKAASEALKDKPSFIPTAFEVLAKCKKTLNTDAFLGDEYHKLENVFIGSTSIYQNHCNFDYEIRCLRSELNHETDPEKISELESLIAQNEEQRFIEKRMFVLFRIACEEAERAYDENERKKYSQDLIKFGISGQTKQLQL